MLFTPARRYRQKVLQLIGQSWGEACKTLFKEFLEWVWRIQEEKGRLVQEYIDAQEELERMKEQLKARGIEPDPKVFEPAKESIFSPLFNQSDDHYVQVLKIFDKAIDSVVKSTPVPEPTRLINVFGLGASSGKRRRTQSIAPSRNGPPVKVVCISPEAPAS
ncbi:hypothetical protein FA13DRAFT_201291 [Coprinellus micaceus]|nr:hypothetical protein FA13DRAFT_201291 [Coprinellus micaceus]